MKLKKLFIISMISMLAASNLYAATAKTMKIGETTTSVTTVVRNSRTLVPLREASELIGAKVDYNAARKLITLTRGNQVVILKIDNAVISVNDLMYKMDTAPITINGSTYLPIRVIAEAFGHTVVSSNGVVTISSIQEAEKVLASSNAPIFKISLTKEDMEFQDSMNEILKVWNPYCSEIEKEFLRTCVEDFYLLADYEKVINKMQTNSYNFNATLSTEVDRIERAIKVNSKIKDDIQYGSDSNVLRALIDTNGKLQSGSIWFKGSIDSMQRKPLVHIYIDAMIEDYNKTVEFYEKAVEHMVSALTEIQS